MTDYICRLWHIEKIRRVLAYFLIGVFGAFFVWDTLTIFNIYLKSVFSALVGWYSLPWAVMFFIVVGILKYKGISLTHSVFLATISSFLASSTWEISLNVMTISFNTTLAQIFLTTALAFPFLSLSIPLLHDSRKLGLKMSNRDYFMAFIVIPISMGLIFLLPIAPSWIFEADGYPNIVVTMILRCFWASMFIGGIFMRFSERAISETPINHTPVK